MKVLTIYAHHDPRSFCHSVLERFTAGLADAGHTSEVVDLYAIKFDPVFRSRDVASYIDAEIPIGVLQDMNLAQHVMDGCRGPLQRWLASRALRGKSPQEIAGLIRSKMPADAREQQEKVRWADGLAFIAPVHFCNFPAILRGWIERVFSYGFAYGLTEAGWHGDVNGRLPLLQHDRALIMTSTLFDRAAYDAGVRDAMDKTIDEWTFRYPGIGDVEHVYFYTAASARPETIRQYLERAYELGRDYEKRAADGSPPR
ncbi:MAG TPA: NAD(P)H-dependent oxidoreductase [Kribbella sp.]|nr:NAD(P)H-dependent oxidoreductase [Kribbella sp.]